MTYTLSVRRHDIFISRIGLRMASGAILPAGTAFVCRRGGHQAELVFQRPADGGLAMVTMPKQRIAGEMRRGLRNELPIRLAAAFSFPLDHIPRTRPVAGRRYLLRIPMPSLSGETLPQGTLVEYNPMNGLHVFNIVGRIHNGFPARLIFGEDDLRALAPCLDAPNDTREVA
jgi:hypothetical protein